MALPLFDQFSNTYAGIVNSLDLVVVRVDPPPPPTPTASAISVWRVDGPNRTCIPYCGGGEEGAGRGVLSVLGHLPSL